MAEERWGRRPYKRQSEKINNNNSENVEFEREDVQGGYWKKAENV